MWSKVSVSLIVGFCLLLVTETVLAEWPEGLLIFPGFLVGHLSDLPAESSDDKHDATASADIFYSFDRGKFRFLGEFFIDKEEAELERLQFGWKSGESATWWIGRYHNPIGYWNTQFHHGQYLPTSITRPGIVAFEDEGGLQSLHISGLLFEGANDLGKGSFNYTFSLGGSPELTDEGLMPLNLFKPNAQDHDLSSAAQLSWKPDFGSESRYGISLAYARIPSDLIGISEIEQTHASLFVNQDWQDWKVTGVWTYLNNQVQPMAGAADSSSFSNAYVQLEHVWQDRWTLFARVEESFSENQDTYLYLFPDFVSSRQAGGLRYDFGKNMAFTLEFGRDSKQSGSFNTVALQWVMLIR